MNENAKYIIGVSAVFTLIILMSYPFTKKRKCDQGSLMIDFEEVPAKRATTKVVIRDHREDFDPLMEQFRGKIPAEALVQKDMSVPYDEWSTVHKQLV